MKLMTIFSTYSLVFCLFKKPIMQLGKDGFLRKLVEQGVCWLNESNQEILGITSQKIILNGKTI